MSNKDQNMRWGTNYQLRDLANTLRMHAHSHITLVVAAMESCFVLRQDKAAVHGCHCRSDMAVRMRKVLARSQSW